MTPVVVRPNQSGREAGKRGTLAASRPRAAAAHPEHVERDCGRAICGHDPSFGVRRDVRIGAGIRNATRLPVHVTPILNFSRALKAPGGLILSGNARVQFRQEFTRCIAQAFHLQCSLCDAPELHEQSHIGAAHELGAISQELGFFSQGGTDG